MRDVKALRPETAAGALVRFVSCSLVLLLLSCHWADAATAEPCTRPGMNTTLSTFASCTILPGCIWYSETSECMRGHYCNPTWSQSICEKPQYQGTCEWVGGSCQVKQQVDSIINRGLYCLTSCGDGQIGDGKINEQCDFCGAEGICCDISDPNPACTPEYNPSTQYCYSSQASTHCCSGPPPPTQSPSLAPTSSCTRHFSSNACEKEQKNHMCVWYGTPDGCQRSGYCNPSWSLSVCQSIRNIGTCYYSGGVCLQRAVPLPVQNEGVNCNVGCNPGVNGQTQCSLCGSEGVCCSRDAPDNCRPNLSVCTGSYCCSQPGTWAPTSSAPSLSPSTSRPTRSPSSNPTISPSANPTTSQPTSGPTTGVPTNSPTLRPSSATPSLAPTTGPTVFGSTVEVVSSTGRFEPSIHYSNAFYRHVCDIFTAYWFVDATQCDPQRIAIRIEPNSASSLAPLTGDDTTIRPNLDIIFHTFDMPTNTSAVNLGHVESNRELRKRIASLQFMVVDLDPTKIQSAPPTTMSGASSQSTTINTVGWIGIGVGGACFLLLLVLIVLGVRKRRQSDGNNGYYITGYQPRSRREYPENESYRKSNIYIPPTPRDVIVVRGSDFRTVPPTSKDYVAEETGNVFSVSQKELPSRKSTGTLVARSGFEDSDFISSDDITPPRPPKPARPGIGRTLSSRSYRSDAQEDRKSLRRGSHRSHRSEDNDDALSTLSREESLYRHQMAPYFPGRPSEAGDDELESLPAMPPAQQSKRGSLTSLASDRSLPGGGSYRARKYEDIVVHDTVNKNGMSDWI